MTQEYGGYVVDVCENYDTPNMFDVYIYEGEELVDCDFARNDDPFSLMEEAFGIIDRCYLN